MVELEAVELGLKLADFIAVGIHLFLCALPILVDLLYDNFGVAISEQALDDECGGDLETICEGVVFGGVVCFLED